jgi:hypothetical protein
MSIIFSPNGSLDVAKDPSDLPESAAGTDILSGAMVRCKNLRLSEQGKAKTRDGSAKLHSNAIATEIWWIEEQGGVRYVFAGENIYHNTTQIETDLTSAQWAAIKYNAFNDTTQQIYALNGTDRKRIQSASVYEWGIAAPTSGPTVRSGGGGGLTGEYNAKYTYVRKVGSTVVSESDPSPAATTSAVLTNGSLAITPTQPTDTQVTHIRFYRTSANGSTYSYAGEVAANTTYAFGYAYTSWDEEDEHTGTGWKFTTSDSTHSTENTYTWEERFLDLATSVTAPTYTSPFDTFDSTLTDGNLGDLVETDHDRPPTGEFVFGPAYDGTCFIIDANLLYYCKPKQPEYWPATYFIEVSTRQFPLKTGVFHNGQPFVFSKNEIFYIQGTGHGTFMPLPMKSKTGAQSVNGAVSVDGKGIYHTGPDGIYLYASGSDRKITEDSLEPLFRGEDVQGMPGVVSMTTSWLHVFKNHLYFGYQSSGFDYPVNVLILNLETNRLAYYTYDDGDPIEIRAVTTDETNDRLLIGDNTGFVRVIEDPDLEDDDDEPVAWEVQSKDYTLQTRKHFPRWCKYDVEASDATTCTGALILGGEVHHSHTITGSRNTRRRLVGTGNGNRAAIRISGTGPAVVYSAEAE